MLIRVNGRQEEAIAGMTLLEYLRNKGLDPGQAVVEYNQQVVERDQWGSIGLKENDQLEVLRFVGGG
ncbi:sulfur carrier protein ThiS [Acetonema longum]|uniref:Thiamine biosynthesis protein ThiS n=1 Tax=Acetonema longum DSM 6540 TaxID=1009370 RepID=F7NKT1_9FIRM|nr:sulfur carrier protein ThiS [Acetonema longum]EGO63385.1 thiamine biosynthesis protein ThiS [Acetonema longum DSM 6540]